jgi:undecaprenyl-diphosphatase
VPHRLGERERAAPPGGGAARSNVGRWTTMVAASRAVTRSVDSWVDARFKTLRASSSATALMVRVSNLGVYSLIWLLLGLAGLFGAEDDRLWYVFLCAVPIEFILTNGPVKSIFRRHRPIEPVDRLEARGLRRPRTSSFPSGHSSAAAMAAVALIGTGWVGLLAVILAALIASSRIFLRLHYPSDVIAGLIWGVSLGLVVRVIGH